MKHIDLFSGIGGFAYAVDQVWDNAEHIFCDNDKFCQQVLKKHWPNSKIYGDIRQFTANAERDRRHSEAQQKMDEEADRRKEGCGFDDCGYDLLTGGFPCQPFSQAGRRRGTEDDRYLWPEMLRVIREFHPRWVIGENVGGFVTWNGGMVLQQVCADLENTGYEVQPFIIPACAVNAPHRRDRVWIVANCNSGGIRRHQREGVEEGTTTRSGSQCDDTHAKSERNRGCAGQECGIPQRIVQPEERQGSEVRGESERCFSWNDNWLEVATEFCGVDDRLPVELDGFELSKARHRKERLKSLGNAIVPAVAVRILKVIKQVDPCPKTK